MSAYAFTDDQVVSTLRSIVAERPDFVYQAPLSSGGVAQCLYVHGDAPGCLVGHVLHRLGVPLSELGYAEGEPADYVLTALGIEVSEAACSILSGVQFDQDSGTSWGLALSMNLPAVAA